MKKVLVLDTSIFCVWLKLPGFERCGPDVDFWDFSRIDAKIQKEIKDNAKLILPLATIIESGNHLSQREGNNYERAKAFCEILLKSVHSETPWAAFADQSHLWQDENLKKLAETWPQLAVQKISIGDATIKDVAEYYSKAGFHVEILTGDRGLKAYEPIYKPTVIPRRKQ